MKWLEKATYTLLQDEPYYAHFLLNSRIVFNKFKVDTAFAGVVDGSCVIGFNTAFMESLSDEETISVVKHEILHLVMEHHNRIDIPNLNRNIWGLAVDTAINQYISNLPAAAVTYEKMSESLGKDLEKFQSAEYYYHEMMKKKKEMEGNDLRTVDDHDVEIPDQTKSTEEMKAVVQSASSKALNAAKGVASSDLIKLIGNLSDKPKLNWKSILRNFVANSTSTYRIDTRKKTNRRFGLDQPGKKKKRELVLGVCVDTSGSVSDEQYCMFLTELQSIVQNTNKIYLIQADSEVKDVQELKKKKDIPLQRSGYGGTAYNPAIKKCSELRCDAIVYMGDGDTSDLPENPHIPLLWVMVGNGDAPANFGAKVKLE